MMAVTQHYNQKQLKALKGSKTFKWFKVKVKIEIDAAEADFNVLVRTLPLILVTDISLISSTMLLYRNKESEPAEQ